MVLLEFAGLILLTDAALCIAHGFRPELLWRHSFTPRTRCSAWRSLLSALAILVALPYVGLGDLAYRFLLSDADIHYFLAERPPRFWGRAVDRRRAGIGVRGDGDLALGPLGIGRARVRAGRAFDTGDLEP